MENKEDLFYEILKATEGRDINRIPNSAINLTNQIITAKNEEDFNDENNYKVITEHSSIKPEVKVQLHGEFVQVDLIYLSALDPEMNILFNHLEKYGSTLDKEIRNTEDKECLSVLTITPLYYEGKYYFCCFNPIFWTKQPSSTTKKENNSIRLLYRIDCLNFYEVPDFNKDKFLEEFTREEDDKDIATNEEIRKNNERLSYLQRENELH